MKYSTLRTIEEALKNEITVRESNLKEARRVLDDKYKEEEFDEDVKKELECWEIKVKEALNKLSDASEALENFYSHDWR